MKSAVFLGGKSMLKPNLSKFPVTVFCSVTMLVVSGCGSTTQSVDEKEVFFYTTGKKDFGASTADIRRKSRNDHKNLL